MTVLSYNANNMSDDNTVYQFNFNNIIHIHLDINIPAL